MAARGKKFSFLRMVNSAFPNFARDDPDDVDLTPSQADRLLTYQLALPQPRYLSESSFFIAEIAGNESMSKKVYKALVKHGIILARPDDVEGSKGRKSSIGSMFGSGGSSAAPVGESVKGESTMTVMTDAIGRNFTNQLAVISVHAQRKLVGMLFFWEEECIRWKLLDEEEAEILRAVEHEGEGNRDLSVALEAVEMKKKMLPSRRAEAVANVSAGQGHTLPTYA